MRLNKTRSISKTIPSMSVCKMEANDREGKISLNQSFVHGKAYSLFYRMFNLKLVWPRSKIFHSSWVKLRTSAFWKSIKRCLLKVVLDGGIRIQNRGALFDTWALILLIFDDQVFMQIANKCQQGYYCSLYFRSVSKGWHFLEKWRPSAREAFICHSLEQRKVRWNCEYHVVCTRRDVLYSVGFCISALFALLVTSNRQAYFLYLLHENAINFGPLLR